jgi:hypothetical protein
MFAGVLDISAPATMAPWEKRDDSVKRVKLNDLSRRSGARRRNGSDGPLGLMGKVFS